MIRRLLPLLLCGALLPLPAGATQVQEVVSKSGFTAWLVEEHALPLVAVSIAFQNSGYGYDVPGKEGRANMTAAMLTEGAGDMDWRAFNKALESHAIQFNAGADEDSFSLTAESLSEHKDKAFRYLGLALTRPRFDADALERTRRQTLALIKQQEQNPGYLLSRGWQQLAFGDHPYGRPQLGFAGSVAAMQKDDLQYVAGHYLTRDNILIAVVGDITAQELGDLLDEHLGGLAPHYDPDASVSDATLPQAAKSEVIDYDIPQTMVTFGTNAIKRDDPGYYAAYVMNQILGGGGALNSRLGDEIREKRGLTYGVSSGLDPMMHAASWQGQFATRNEKAGEALEVLRSTIKQFAAKGPTDTELSDAKEFLTGSFVLHLDSNADIARFLINMQQHHLGRDYMDKRNGLIEAVSKKEVTDVTKRIIDPGKLLVVMIGKPKADKP